ncbi:zinc ribbon domain-containing protein [Falsirhodobacter sp. 1013]|uniref:zinc ribbon domain-containing protein n=1 Tax=Falsirhodobacter sp. 1013 TaxID=3417566 RepID=UPI003EB8139C
MTFALQCCTDCGRWQYPTRSLCAGCLGDLEWRDHDGLADLTAQTLLHHSLEEAWDDRLPLRLGTARIGPGADMLVVLDADCPPPPSRVRVSAVNGIPMARGA